MQRIRVENFGPIKEGFTDTSDGFMDIPKITVFIGNQGSGKSTVAKLISTFTWLEKALMREQLVINEITAEKFISKYLSFHLIADYVTDTTEIQFKGQCFSFSYINHQMSIKALKPNKEKYYRPQIMYIPSERNFCSVLKNPNKIDDLPYALSVMLEEYDNAKIDLENKIFALPITDMEFQFETATNRSFISNNKHSYKIELHKASSGIQFVVPLSLVTEYLSDIINKETDNNRQAFNLNDCFMNIVEEPEQNLFPNSQKDVLFHLLSCVNKNENNSLIFTTHSPYLLPYLNLAIKARELVQNKEAAADLGMIVPPNSCIEGDTVMVYHCSSDGKIRLLPKYKNMPSEDNILNELLDETNELYRSLLVLEKKYVN